MGYSTTQEVDIVLAQALTTANPSSTTTPIKLINIGNERNLNLVTDDTVKQYIIYSDSQIDGILSEQYQTPLRKCLINRWNVTSSAVGSTTVVMTSHDFLAGDEMIIRCESQGLSEVHTVATVVNSTTITMNSALVSNLTPAACTDLYVAKSAYPHPINQVSSRLAASFIYDKYFAAQVDPNISNYGKEMRAVAYGQLNDVLKGIVILRNQLRIGERFGNAYLTDSYSHHTPLDGYQDRSSMVKAG